MKKIITLFFLALSAGLFAQDYEKEGKVLGSIEIGNQEVTSIIVESTGCIRKTNVHMKGLFSMDEIVHLRETNNKKQYEVTKPNLSKNVYTDKECIGNVNNNLNPYEIVGELHNQYLSEILELETPSNVDVFEYAIIKLNSIQTSSQGDIKLVNDFITGFESGTVNQYNGMSITQILQPILTTNYGFIAAQKLDKIIEEGGTAEKIIEKVTQLEKSLTNNKSISEAEKATLLSTTAVTRHSVKFWYDNDNDDTPGMSPVVKADLRSAAGASAAAAVISFFFAPVAPLVWAVGVGVSAAVGSATAYFLD